MVRRLVLFCFVALGAACATARTSPPEQSSSSSIHFIENDFGAALALARQSSRPLFIDVWTTWCHTCQSMRAYVFPDRALERVASQFVWLSVDAESERNTAFLDAFPVSAYPTLFVLDPRTQQATRRWLGSVTAPELAARLSDVAEAWTPGNGTSEAERALARGDAASAAGKSARGDYERALSASPPSSLIHAQAVEALLNELSDNKQYLPCVRLAQKELPKTPPGTSLANVAAAGLSCALELPKADPERARAVEDTVKRVAELASDPRVVMLADDRSSLYETLVDARDAEGDGKGATDAARAWASFLEVETEKATTPAARAVFDPHRLLAYMRLGEVQKAVPMLEASERALPNDYNPPARLATAYLKLGKPKEALQEAQRAESLAYGPRTVRILLTKADAQAALGDATGVEASLAKADRIAGTALGHQHHQLQEAVSTKRKAYQKAGLLSGER
jgi:thioredoxin-like negative regulator of GroEL